MCGCQGECREQLGNLTYLRKTIASGFARCTVCNFWMDWRFCHLKGDIPANRESLGLFCNCCNYRVRQNARSKKSKDILKKLKKPQKGHRKEAPKEDLRKELELASPGKESFEIIQKIKSKNQLNTKKWNDLFEENQSKEIQLIDTGKSIDELRKYFEDKFSDDDSVLKRFKILENHLTLLHNNKKYDNVNYFLKT